MSSAVQENQSNSLVKSTPVMTRDCLPGGEIRSNAIECCGSYKLYYCLEGCCIPFVTCWENICVHCACSCFCFKPKRPTWTRSFQIATSALRNASQRIYVKADDVRVCDISLRPLSSFTHIHTRTHTHTHIGRTCYRSISNSKMVSTKNRFKSQV